MRVCFLKSNNLILEAQSGDHGDLDVLIANAVAAGYKAGDVRVAVVPDHEFYTAVSAQNAAERAPERTRIEAFKASPDRVDLIDKLKTATPAQIDTWIENNVTNIAGAKAVLKAIIKVLALQVRE